MNVDNQTILHVGAKQLPPDVLFKHILEKRKPNAFGFVVQNVENGKPDLSITREDASNLSFDELKKLFVAAKEFPISCYFGKLTTSYDPDDIQPFVITDGDDNPFIAIMLEGTINGHDDPREHTEQYNYCKGILIPKITEWCEDFEGDLEKIAAKLRGDVFKNEFMMHVGHRAALHIVPVEGDMINLGKNDLAGIYDWGSISIAGDWDKPAATSVPAEAAPKKGGFGWGKNKAAAVPGVTTDGNGIHTVTGKDGKPVHDAGTKVEKKEAPNLAARPPAWLLKNDDLKLWYRIVGHKSESNWKKRLPCIVVDFEAAKIDNLRDFLTYALKKQLETSGATATSSGKPPAETGKQDVKNISGVAGDVELPIIGPKQLEKVLEFVAEHLDGNSKEIIDPKEMQGIEKELPKFSAAVGLSVQETINWPLAGLIGIGNTDVKALALYAMEWRALARPHVIAAVQKETKGNIETTRTDLGNGSSKTESIDKGTPAKKGFGWGKKAA